MTRARKPAKVHRTNKNRHYRSKLKPKVQKLIDVLRTGWAAMGALERGQRINRLVSIGCSRRGLGRELKQSATSIRRHVEIACLPEEDRRAIAAGASVKKILALKANTARQRERQQRVDEDNRTGALSRDVATTIIEFCRLGKQLRKDPMIRGNFRRLLDRVKTHLRDFEAAGHRTPKMSKARGPHKLFWKVRPRKVKNSNQLVHQGEWLAEVLWLIEPEPSIRARGLEKALGRAKELPYQKTAIEMWEDRITWLKEVSASPVRPFYPGGAAGSMKRQGRPTETSKPK
jgi:hypothetical protein